MRTYLILALAVGLLGVAARADRAQAVVPGHVPICGDYNLDGQVTIADITSFIAPVRRIDTSPGDANFDAAWDRLPGPGDLSYHINIQDLIDLLPVPRPCLDSVQFLSKLTDLDAQWNADPTATAAMMNASYEGIQTFDCPICREFGNAFNGVTYVYQDPTKICGPSDPFCSPECEGEQPGTDCSDILLTTTGQRCWQRFFNGSRYIADVTQPDVRDEIVAKAITLIADPAFDAYYVDVAEAWLPNAADCPGTPSVSNALWLAAWATLAQRLQVEVPGLLILNSQYVTWNNLVATSPANADLFWGAPDVVETEFGWIQGRHGEGTAAGSADKLAYIDRLHGLGTGVYDFERRADDTTADYTAQQEIFGLAMYLVTATPGDYYGSYSHDGHGSAFAALYELVVGDPLGARYQVGSEYRRDYERGTVRANPVTKLGVIP